MWEYSIGCCGKCKKSVLIDEGYRKLGEYTFEGIICEECSNETYEEYLHKLIKDKYINNDCSPLKCFYCDSDNLLDYDEHYNDVGREEYSVKCKDCDKHIATWAYGYWYID